MRRYWWLLPLLVLLAIAGWWFLLRAPAEDAAPKVETVEVVARMPHDSGAFTQGLSFDGGTLIESTGEEGTSGIRRVKLDTGEVLASKDLDLPYFGEGSVRWKDKLYQITWKDQKGFIFDAATLAPKGEFAYKGEGWGLTQDGSSIIMSDGTAVLRFLDPETMAQKSTLAVTAKGCPVSQLNELEWIDGEIWANIWQTDLIARIDPKTGKVKSFVDVAALGPVNPGIDEVPNGIAYDAAGKRIFVTGKMWPELYQVRVTEGPASGAANDAAAKLTSCQPS